MGRVDKIKKIMEGKMILFLFIINDSFLNYVNHPITIPNAHYDQIKREGLGPIEINSRMDVKISSSTGRRLDGWIYYSKTHEVPYYQIRIQGGYFSDYLGFLKRGEPILVYIDKLNNEIIIGIFDSKQINEINKTIEDSKYCHNVDKIL